MNKVLVIHDLYRAERNIVAGKKQIAEQIEFIAWLGWFNVDTAGARGLLREFERALAKHMSERELLRAQLSQWDGVTGQGVPA